MSSIDNLAIQTLGSRLVYGVKLDLMHGNDSNWSWDGTVGWWSGVLSWLTLHWVMIIGYVWLLPHSALWEKPEWFRPKEWHYYQDSPTHPTT